LVIKFNLKALAGTQWHEYAIRFSLGGALTMVTGWVASRYGPVIGGILLGLPVIFPASATLVEKHESDKKRAAGIPFTIRGRLAAALDARGAVLGALGGLVFAATVWQLLPTRGPLWALPLGLLGWITIATLLWYVRKHHPWRGRSGNGTI
jgi:hypothetical protein